MDPDEGRYSEIPREMVESGDFVTPRLNYVKYFEKPAFLYWANALAYKMLGENEFASRITVALCALLGILVTGLLGGYMYGKLAAWFAAIVCGSSFLYFAIGTLDILDMPLAFFLTLSMAAFYVAQREDSKLWYLLFYDSAALAVLTKGLIGVVLPGGIIFIYILVSRRWRLFYKSLYIPAILLFFAITVPWFYMVCKANADFFHFFFIQEHFERYLTKMHDRYEPFWFFTPILLAGILPWTAFLPGFFCKQSVFRMPADSEQKDANRYLIIWALFIFIFFSISDSKLIPYIVPCISPISIMIAAELDRMVADNRAHGAISLCLALTSGIFGLALIIYPLTGGYVTFAQAWKVVAIASPALLLMPLIAKICFARREISGGIAGLVLCAVVFICGVQPVYGIIAPTRSLKDAASVVLSVKREKDVVVAYGDVMQGLSFYTKERVMCVNAVGELAYGSKQPEAEGWFITGDEFIKLWEKGDKRYIVVVEDKHGDKAKEILPPHLLSRVKIVRSKNNKYTVLYKED